MEELRALLAKVSALSTVPAEGIEALLEHVALRSYAEGERILRFGDPGRVVCVLVEGRARVLRVYEDGDHSELGTVTEGQLFGEMSLLTGEPTSADVVAEGDCRVACWSQSFFSRFIARHPGVALDLAKELSSRLSARQVDEDAQRRVRQARRAQEDPYDLEDVDGPRRILVLSCGASSLRYDLVDWSSRGLRRRGVVEPIGSAEATHRRILDDEEKTETLAAPDHRAAVAAVLSSLEDAGPLEAVGHRVVHGGERHVTAEVIDDEVVASIRSSIRLAPLHNPANLAGIEACQELLPDLPQVAVFDTAFHHTMPRQASLYAIPEERSEGGALRRYGFHGPSHQFVALRAATYLRRPLSSLKLVTCHLGRGASVCAIEHGRSIDTSMGLTPLEGLVMGTRSGDVDPALPLLLQREKGMTADEVEDLLNRRSGLLGLSGRTGEVRELIEAADGGDARALVAIQAYCYRVKKYVGAYVAALGGLDALVFTAGVGEHSRGIRARICQGLAYLGVVLDEGRNAEAVGVPQGEVVDIAEARSSARILVIPTDEERMIARETARALSRSRVTMVLGAREHLPIPIEVSAHHVHLQPEHVAVLFGPGHELTPRAELSQPGQFACVEAVDLVGPRGTVERVRVLGPCRKRTQVEISRTEEFKLGIDAPVRASGDLGGTPGLVLKGPRGTCRLDEGVICALRHIHMAPEDALAYGLRDRDMVRIGVRGERPLSFGGVLVRISPDYRLAMHVDTDEANAAEIDTGATGFIEKIEERA